MKSREISQNHRETSLTGERCLLQKHRGTGFAGPLVLPPGG